MRVFNDIEGLIYYANVHLMLDELDIVLIRNQVLDELRIKDYIISQVDYASIENLTEPSTLLAPILEYAVSQGITTTDQMDEFASKIMGLLVMRPSDLIDIFGGFKKPQKVSEWFYDYNIKSGYIKINQSRYKHWDAKGTVGKLEVSILNHTKESEGCVDSYPECDICIENEGHHNHRRHTLRTVPVVIGKQDWFWYYVQDSILSHQIVVANNNHIKAKLSEDSLDWLFDFGQVMPHYFVACDSNTASNEHQHLIGGYKMLPLFRAKNRLELKCAKYPLVELGIVDWYSTVLRIVGVDRVRMLECGKAVVREWLGYGNTFGACLHKDKEGKFILEISLSNSNGHAVPFRNTELGILDILGMVYLDGITSDDLSDIERYITKEVKYSPDKLSVNLASHQSIVDKLVRDVGSSKISALEAQLNIKDELNAASEKLLSSMAIQDSDLQQLWTKLDFVKLAK
jgi:UDPglucose--hexose-1-phosphate uridylyltransferase